jgi:hypothetical protein
VCSTDSLAGLSVTDGCFTFERFRLAMCRREFVIPETAMRRCRDLRMVKLVALAVACAGVSSANGDLLYFRNGGAIQVPAKAEGDRLVVEMPDGRVSFARDVISKRVAGYWPAAEWDMRRREAVSKGFEARLATVWCAIENGLTSEAAGEIRELHAVDGKHAQVARMAAALERLDRSCDDPDFARFARALLVQTKVARGPHVILLHQHSEAEAGERIELLERVIAGYYLVFAAQGLELSVPRTRLVSAWFAEKKDYLAFLHSQGADAFSTTRGYYHPTWKAVVAYEGRATDAKRSDRERFEARREELAKFSEMVNGAPAGSRLKVQLAGEPGRTIGRSEAKPLIARLDGEASAELLMLDLDRRAVDLGTAAHEMIHQLATASGLLPRYDAFPNWLHEGLAAQFEVIRGGRWAGISRANDLRLPNWRSVQSPLTLERLVRDAGFGHGYQRDLYAQAWALVYFLRTQHPHQFLTFIDLLRGPGSADSSSAGPRSDPVLSAFQHAFGSDLLALEREWREFMAGVQTPLEQQAPGADSKLKKNRAAADLKSRES